MIHWLFSPISLPPCHVSWLFGLWEGHQFIITVATFANCISSLYFLYGFCTFLLRCNLKLIVVPNVTFRTCFHTLLNSVRNFLCRLLLRWKAPSALSPHFHFVSMKILQRPFASHGVFSGKATVWPTKSNFACCRFRNCCQHWYSEF